MIQSLNVAFLALFLTACVSRSPDFKLPEQVNFQGITYQKVTQNRLDEMQQHLYLPVQQTPKNLQNWQQGILFFVDKNTTKQTLAERLALRQNVFKKQSETQAKLWISEQELRSEVIYPPTERFHNVQVELSRGRNLPCGFGQIQFSDKQLIDPSLFAKKRGELTAYRYKMVELARQFEQLPWLIGCK